MPSEGPPQLYYLDNLTSALNKAVLDGNELGGSNQGVYAQLWHTTTGRMDGPISNHMWQSTRVSHAARRMTLQARFGTLYNARIAMRMNRPYMLCNTAAGKCPLCGGDDSIGHMLGGCSHPTMHALYIARHDEAVRIIAKAMRKGNMLVGTTCW